MCNEDQTTNRAKIQNYLHYIVTPLKIAGCWEIYPKTEKEREMIINGMYLALVSFVLINAPVTLAVHLYTEWADIMSSLDNIADSLPLIVSLAIVSYHALHKDELYALVKYMNNNFKFHSAAGVTNMTMEGSYAAARNFWKIYTGCTMFSVTMYVLMPAIVHLWTKEPIQHWQYMEATCSPYIELVFLRSCLAQLFVGLAMGQFGVFFASNSILICGQLDLICCSLRNARYTALLRHGVQHAALVATNSDIQKDETHSYVHNVAVTKESVFSYDTRRVNNFTTTQFDIYNPEYDRETVQALGDCAAMCQVVNKYKDMFESFMSPLLALRVVQVTLYLCTLLYAATLKFDMITVEYLAAVALDIFIYCYYGNQIILQAERVSTAAYQSAWHTMGVRPRRVLLNILLANRRPVVVRAGRFLPMDLHTFVVIIKTSFSYYTLLVNVNEK